MVNPVFWVDLQNRTKGFWKTSGYLFQEIFQEVGAIIEGSLNFLIIRKVNQNRRVLKIITWPPNIAIKTPNLLKSRTL